MPRAEAAAQSPGSTQGSPRRRALLLGLIAPLVASPAGRAQTQADLKAFFEAIETSARMPATRPAPTAGPRMVLTIGFEQLITL